MNCPISVRRSWRACCSFRSPKVASGCLRSHSFNRRYAARAASMNSSSSGSMGRRRHVHHSVNQNDLFYHTSAKTATS
jgi:hypothetical protein